MFSYRDVNPDPHSFLLLDPEVIKREIKKNYEIYYFDT